MIFVGAILITSVVSMSAITYDRLTAIVLPQETRLSKNGAKIVMTITWILGVILSIPISLYRTYKVKHLNIFGKQITEKKKTGYHLCFIVYIGY